MITARPIRKLYQTQTAGSFICGSQSGCRSWSVLMTAEKIGSRYSGQPPVSNKLYLDNFMADFPLFSISVLRDNCNWECHNKVFIYNFIRHGAWVMAYRASATPEPLCCGRPLVYCVLCKIRKELDPKRSPLRCNQPNRLQQKARRCIPRA